MTDFYVRSSDGLDSDSGATFALAKASLAGVAAGDVAGDNAYVSSLHAETVSATVTWAFAGTPASPVRIICVPDGVEPPVGVANTASVSTTGNFVLDITGSFYQYGMKYFSGTGTGNPVITFKTGARIHDNCYFETVATGFGGFRFSDGTRTDLQSDVLKNCSFKFAATTNRIFVEGDFNWEGGSIAAGTITPARLFYVTPRPMGRMQVSGVDFSALANTFNFFDNATPVSGFRAILRRCKLPSGWPSGGAGLFNAAPTVPGIRAELHDCDGADTKGRLRIEDYSGTLTTETTVLRTGGANDGTTSYSWKMASTANAGSLVAPFNSGEIAPVDNAVVGTPITVTVDVLHDSVTNLTDAEIYLSVQYMAVTGFPLSGFMDDSRAHVMATPQDQTASTATWTTTGLTNPNKQKLSVTFTPQRAGIIQARVVLCKASKTVYVDPKLQVA